MRQDAFARIHKAETNPESSDRLRTIEENPESEGQFTGLTLPGAGLIEFSSFQRGRTSKITFPDGTVRELTFNEDMNVEEITVTDRFNNIILKFEYGYDERGNIISRKAGTGDYRYVYDGFSRLTEVQKEGRSLERYVYDGFGNRLLSLGADNWKYGSDNRLLSYGSTKFDYDARGNTIKIAWPDSIQGYIYDGAGRLIEVRDGEGGLIARYGYDERGRRIRKEVFKNHSPSSLIEPVEMSAQCASSKTEITNYLYFEHKLIGEYDTEGTEIRAWFYNPSSGIEADPLFMRQNGQYYFCHNDHLGTPQKITGINGEIVWSATYDAFGSAVIDPKSTITCNLRFPGQYFDSETGLHYNIYRYYNPATGRYLSKDPLNDVIEGSNLYSYAYSNPLKFYDPLGLWCWVDHYAFFERQFPRMKPRFLRYILDASDKVDGFEHQGAAFSHWHSMRKPNSTRSEAIQLIGKHISDHIGAIKSLKEEKDFKNLGIGLHCLQDMICPLHTKQKEGVVVNLDNIDPRTLDSLFTLRGPKQWIVHWGKENVLNFLPADSKTAWAKYAMTYQAVLDSLGLNDQLSFIQKIEEKTKEGLGPKEDNGYNETAKEYADRMEEAKNREANKGV